MGREGERGGEGEGKGKESLISKKKKKKNKTNRYGVNQSFFEIDHPMILLPTDSFLIRCVFDTTTMRRSSVEDDFISVGMSKDNEMCAILLVVSSISPHVVPSRVVALKFNYEDEDKSIVIMKRFTGIFATDVRQFHRKLRSKICPDEETNIECRDRFLRNMILNDGDWSRFGAEKVTKIEYFEKVLSKESLEEEMTDPKRCVETSQRFVNLFRCLDKFQDQIDVHAIGRTLKKRYGLKSSLRELNRFRWWNAVTPIIHGVVWSAVMDELNKVGGVDEKEELNRMFSASSMNSEIEEIDSTWMFLCVAHGIGHGLARSAVSQDKIMKMIKIIPEINAPAVSNQMLFRFENGLNDDGKMIWQHTILTGFIHGLEGEETEEEFWNTMADSFQEEEDFLFRALLTFAGRRFEWKKGEMMKRIDVSCGHEGGEVLNRCHFVQGMLEAIVAREREGEGGELSSRRDGKRISTFYVLGATSYMFWFGVMMERRGQCCNYPSDGNEFVGFYEGFCRAAFGGGDDGSGGRGGDGGGARGEFEKACLNSGRSAIYGNLTAYLGGL